MSGYSSRVARSRLKPGTRRLTFLSCADHSCRRKKQRCLGRTKAWKKLRDLERNYNTRQPAGNPLPFRTEGEPQCVGWFTLCSETSRRLHYFDATLNSGSAARNSFPKWKNFIKYTQNNQYIREIKGREGQLHN